MSKHQINYWHLFVKTILLNSALLIIVSLLNIGCQSVEIAPDFLESTQSASVSGQTTTLPTTTPTSLPSPISPQVNQRYGNSTEGEYGHIDIYGTILQRYADILSDPILPQETRTALVGEQAIIVADATAWALPILTIDASGDWSVTAESIRATAYAIPYISPTPIRGMLYGELAEGDPRDPARTNSGWRGYVQSIEVGAFVGRLGWGADTGYVGLVALYEYSITSPSVYTQTIGEGITETLKLQAVLEDRYLVMEVFDYAVVKQPNSVGTGEMYYFDMVTREFMSQSTAEFQISNFPLQAETTPTPPIAVTIPPIQPQHPRQP